MTGTIYLAAFGAAWLLGFSFPIQFKFRVSDDTGVMVRITRTCFTARFLPDGDPSWSHGPLIQTHRKGGASKLIIGGCLAALRKNQLGIEVEPQDRRVRIH